jgi:hypothetical protein
MPSFERKLADGSYREVANTLGTLISKGADRLVFLPATKATLDLSLYVYSPNQIVESKNMSIDSNGYVPVKPGDSYIVQFPETAFGTGTWDKGSLSVCFFDSDKTLLGYIDRTANKNPDGNTINADTINVVVPSNCAFLLMRLYSTTAITNIGPTSQPYDQNMLVVKVSQQMPYAITAAGVVKSSDDPGKGNIDENTGDITINNVYPSYVFATKEEFEAAEASIPDGARVTKLYEYPESYQPMLPEADLGNATTLLETTLTGTGTVNSGWCTAPNTGYIRVYFGSTGTTAASVGLVRVRALYKSTGAEGYVLFDNDKTFPAYSNDSRIMPCAKGDQFRFVVDGPTNLWCSIAFIPVKLVVREAPIVVEKNGSYSLLEVKTADKWIDGKPIYRMTFTCNIMIPTTSNGVATGTTIADLDLVVRGEVTTNTYSTMNGVEQLNVYANKNTKDIFLWGEAFNQTVSYLRYVTIYYTKSTD